MVLIIYLALPVVKWHSSRIVVSVDLRYKQLFSLNKVVDVLQVTRDATELTIYFWLLRIQNLRVTVVLGQHFVVFLQVLEQILLVLFVLNLLQLVDFYLLGKRFHILDDLAVRKFIARLLSHVELQEGSH